MKKLNYKKIEDSVYNYKTKYKEGFTNVEIEEFLKKKYSKFNINMDKFSDAMMGNTCMLSQEKEVINHHCDVYKALLCGLENRGLRNYEWD